MLVKAKTYILLSTLTLCAVMWPGTDRVYCRVAYGEPQRITLLARREVNGYDNYVEAAFSFEHGINGKDSLKVTRNDWDLLFGNSPTPDAFDVTTVADDCSRIKDLGELSWSDSFEVPVLLAHPAPTREPSVKAVLDHMYVVHTKDRETDLYALFRVESLTPGKSVTISWKVIPSPE
jgi:hypothetical protein